MTKRREIMGNGDGIQRIEYAEICKTIKMKAKEDIKKIQPRYHTRNDHGIIQPEESQKNAGTMPRQTNFMSRQAGLRNL